MLMVMLTLMLMLRLMLMLMLRLRLMLMLMLICITKVMEDVWGPIQLPVKYPRGFARASRPSI